MTRALSRILVLSLLLAAPLPALPSPAVAAPKKSATVVPPGRPLPALLPALPAESDLVVVVDLGAALRWFDRMVAFIDALPIVRENPEFTASWNQVRTQIQAGMGMASGFLGIDLRQDLGLAVAGVVLASPATYTAVVSGRVPSDLLSRIAKEDYRFRVGDREGVRVNREAWVVPDGDRVIVTASEDLLEPALARKDARDLLARHPGLKPGLSAGTVLRVSFAPPAWIRTTASTSTLPIGTLVENLQSAVLEVGPDFRLWAEAGNADGLDRIRSLLEAVREATIASGGIARAIGHFAMVLDLDRLPAKDAASRQFLSNREAIRQSFDAIAGSTTLPKPVLVKGRTVELRLDAGSTSGTLFLGGMLAAIAIPQFNKYKARAREAEAKTNLRVIAIAEAAYKDEHGEYLSCETTPAAAPSGEAVPWTGSECFDRLGFTPQGKVFFRYEVKAEKDRFTARAVGAPDGTGRPRTYTLSGPGAPDVIEEEGTK